MSKLIKRVFPLFAPLLMLASISCEQYEYASPTPGIVEIRLAVKNSRLDLLPFTAYDSTTNLQNEFLLRLRTIELVQPGDVRLEIFSSLSARQRNNNGDAFNTLSLEARDSLLLLGIGYVPPGTFAGLQFTMELLEGSLLPPPRVIRTFGAYSSSIPVIELTPRKSFFPFPDVGIPVNEARITRITVTFDMDSSLIQRAEYFNYRGNFHISSITTF